MTGVVGMKTSKRLSLPDWNDDFLSHIDARSRLGYVLKQRLQALEDHVSVGEPERLTYPQRSLIRRALWLEARLELDESRIAIGDPISAGAHACLLNALTNLFRTLGVEPKAKKVPTLRDYIDQQDSDQ